MLKEQRRNTTNLTSVVILPIATVRFYSHGTGDALPAVRTAAAPSVAEQLAAAVSVTAARTPVCLQTHKVCQYFCRVLNII